MDNQKQQNKFTESAIKQNLLLWQISRNLLDLEKELRDQDNTILDVSKNRAAT